MKRAALVLSLFLLSNSSFAQEKIRAIVKIHPLNAVSPVRPYLQGSAEVVFFDKIGLEFGYGQRYLRGEKTDTQFVGLFGRNLLAEICIRKLSIYKENDGWEIYDFAGISYRNVYDNRNLALKYTKSGDEERIDNCAVSTKIDAWALRWGVAVSSNHFVFEAFAEAGYKNQTRYYIANEMDDQNEYHIRGQFGNWHSPSDGINVNLNLGVKFGWKLFSIN